MTRWALLTAGVVANVVDQATAPTVAGPWVAAPASAGPGWGFDGQAWTAPAAPTLARHVTALAFLDRFADAEAVAIDLASQGATAPAAALRRHRSKVDVAAYIDLDRADTRAGVQALETAGLLATGRALQILDAPVQPQERP